jgi:hypothetical protein
MTELMSEDDGVVTYTTKELLAEIHKDLNEIKVQVQAKALQTDLVALSVKLETVERQTDSRAAIDSYKRWFWGVALLALISGAGTMANVAHNFGWVH